jgi:hypothetical protein
MRIDVKPGHHYQATLPPSSHHTRASHANPSLGREAHAPTSAAEAIPGAGAPPEATPATIEECLNRLHIAGLPSTVFTTTS